MKKPQKYILMLSIGLVMFSLGVWYGFHQGIENYAALEGVLSGYIDTGQARRLESRTDKGIQNVHGYLDMNIDQGLDNFSWYLESGNHFLSEIFLNEHLSMLERSVIGLSKYRAEYPEVDFSEALDNPETKKTYLEMLEKRKGVVSEFGHE